MNQKPAAGRRPLLPFSTRYRNVVHPVLLLVTALFFSLHFLHLQADFPNFSRWMDWSKYTDEGWYGDAAIRHYELGHWYVAGDFNPAAALPVWPFLEALLFHFTGVSLVAARALTVAVLGGILLTSWLLIRRTHHQSFRSELPPTTPVSASVVVVLLVASPFCFVFTRLAILEPLLVLLTLLALLAATGVHPLRSGEMLRSILRANILPIMTLGLLLPAMILTKTTAIFLIPAVAWMLFAQTGYRVRTLLLIGLPAATIAAGVWLGWFVLVIRPHLLLDYRYLFSANGYTGITRDNFIQVLSDTIGDGNWIGAILFPLALAAILFSLLRLRTLRRHPLVPSLILWAGGYTAFLAYHANLQPRYYLVVAVPLTLLVPVVFEQLVLPLTTSRHAYRSALLAAVVLFLAVALPDARTTLHFVRHPQYTLLNAARQVHDTIIAQEKEDPAHNPLVLSISGSDLSLMTGLPSICDDFGTLELADRVKKYRPGWYAAWNQIDDDKMDAITPLFHIERVAAFPAMDDPDRNLLILYRLDPTVITSAHPRRRKPIPRKLQTKVGQQPSTSQLQH